MVAPMTAITCPNPSPYRNPQAPDLAPVLRQPKLIKIKVLPLNLPGYFMLLVCELTSKYLWHSFGRSLESRNVVVTRSATPGSIREQQIFQ